MVRFTGHTADQPHIAVIGTWDPPSQKHVDLFAGLKSEADSRCMASLVVTLDPPPAGKPHSDVGLRDILQREADVTSRVVAELNQEEVDGRAEPFLEALGNTVPISELWLGARQTLGRHSRGSQDVIRSYCASAGIELRILPATQGTTGARLLYTGQVWAYAEHSGIFPSWRRPATQPLPLPWPAGIYQCHLGVRPVLRPSLRPVRDLTQVELADAGGVSSLAWPAASGEWLTFVAGPEERPG